jgi:outer membrane protein OmpA-like peptidoglycan-associated protein
MRKNWLLLVLATALVTLQLDASAQQQKDKYRNKANDPVRDLPYYKKIRWADNLFKSGSYFNAIEYYQQLKEEQPRNPYLTYQLAECCWFTRDYAPAANYYGEVYATAQKLYPEAKYKQAIMLKMQGKYDEAIAAFEKFIADNPKTFKKLKIRAKKEIDGAKMAMNTIKDPQPVTIKNAGPNVNSAYTELSPYPLGDTALLFGTMNQNNMVDADKSNRGNYVSRLMVSRKQKFVEDVDSFQWALRFDDGKFNDPRMHVGNGCYSPGGDNFYFTKCDEGEDSGKVICKIYVSKFEGSKWGYPQELGEGINEGGSNTQPFVAKVGKKEVLFFSSNRKLQSRGGFDIWYSVIDPRKGTYRRPQNAGKQINTDKDEVSPYYDTRVGKLYFSSNGWITMGGFDVFSADGGPSRYRNLTNLGYPINSSADEMYFIKDPSGKPDAYLVSNRIGSIALKNPTCCDDIWRIQYEPRLVVIGKVVNQADNSLVQDVVAKMVNDNGEMKTYNSTDGNFAFSMGRQHTYVITGDKQGMSSTRATVNTMDVKRTDADDTAYVTVYMQEIVNAFRVSNIYYDHDKADLRPESIAALDSLVNFMKDNPSLSVEIYAYTDSKGADKYNDKLSLKRAEAVRQYLIQSGVEETRMIAKPLGETNPAAPNTATGGNDNPVGRQLNRRTEFRIVTDVPTRRVIFDSSKPGSVDEQSKNLQMDESSNDETEMDSESQMGTPGSRVNKN